MKDIRSIASARITIGGDLILIMKPFLLLLITMFTI